MKEADHAGGTEMDGIYIYYITFESVKATTVVVVVLMMMTTAVGWTMKWTIFDRAVETTRVVRVRARRRVPLYDTRDNGG